MTLVILSLAEDEGILHPAPVDESINKCYHRSMTYEARLPDPVRILTASDDTETIGQIVQDAIRVSSEAGARSIDIPIERDLAF